MAGSSPTKNVEFGSSGEDRLGSGAKRREVHRVIINMRHDAALSGHRLHVGKGRFGPRRRPVEQKDVRRALLRETLGGDEARAARAACAAMAY